MSTDRQRYSIEHQSITNAAYALLHRLQIVRTYADEGISGLRLDRRDGLKQLLSDVIGGKAGFSCVLVYDVSRWGRFQDADESAHYEFLCRTAGVQIRYCAEPFDNDGTLTSTLAKALKRAMAAEYSRELSDKIIGAKRGLGPKGYWLGGTPGYGLRRCQLDRSGQPLRLLESGEANGLKGNHVVIVPGPPDEVAIVRRIFRMVAAGKTGLRGIAKALNKAGVVCWNRDGWSENRVRMVASNELYAGTKVLGRERTRLGLSERRPRDEWVRVAGACEPIVSKKLFREAQRHLRHKPQYTEEHLLAHLRAILAERGTLSSKVIDSQPAGPRTKAYNYRFGSLMAAYARVGYTMTPFQLRMTEQIAPHRPKGGRWNRLPVSDDELLQRLTALLKRSGYLNLQLMEATPGLPRRDTFVRRFGSLERAYQLAGFEPGRRQKQCFDRARPSVRSK